MRKIGLMSGSTLLVAGGLALALSAPAQANEMSREEMQQRLRELEAQVERLTTQVESGESSALSARVAELEASVAAGGNDLGWYWDNGLRAADASGDFKFKLGGRTQVDFFYPDVDGEVERFNGEQFEDGVRFRRARLYLAGTMYGNVGFKAEYDFAGGGRPSFADVYMTLKHPSLGLVTIGHHYEPFGFENTTSDLFVATMERGAGDAVAFERNTGISVKNSLEDGRWDWHVGAFRQSNAFGDDLFNVGTEEWNYTGRVAGIAWEDADNGDLVHAGASISHREPNRVSPTVPVTLTGVFAPGVQGAGFGGAQTVSATGLTGGAVTGAGVDDGLIWGLDVAYVSNRGYSAWVDYARADYDKGRSDAEISAYRIAGAYTLVGQPRRYDKKKKNFGRPTVGENYGSNDSLGAVEAVLAFDSFSTSGFFIPDVSQWTIGMNWWLNPNTKVVLNLFRGHIDGIGQLKGLGMRFQVDF